MKKMNVLIAVFAVLAAASAAFAAENYGAAAQLADAAGLDQTIPAIGGQMMPELPFHPAPAACNWYDDGCDSPMPFPFLTPDCNPNGEQICMDLGGKKYCYPACYLAAPLASGSPVFARGGGELPALRQVYSGQAAARKALAPALFPSREAQAGFAGAKGVRVIADNKAVYLVKNGKTAVIKDAELAARTREAMAPAQQTRFWFVPAAAVAIECMTNDACWGAVGDAVSNVSEWANS